MSLKSLNVACLAGVLLILSMFVVFPAEGAYVKDEYPYYYDGNYYYIIGGESFKKPYHPDEPSDVKWVEKTGAHNSMVAVPESGDRLYIGTGFRNSDVWNFRPPETIEWIFDMNGSPPTDPIPTNNDAPTIAPNGYILQDGGADRRLYAINSEGKQEWVFETNARVSKSPAVTKEGRVYVANQGGNLYALNLSDGSKIWQKEFRESGELAQITAPVADTRGVVYVGSRYPPGIGDNYNQDPEIDRPGDPETRQKIKELERQYQELIEKAKSGEPVSEEKVIELKQRIEKLKKSLQQPPSQGGWNVRNSGVLYALNPDGSVRWKYSAEGRISIPAIGEDQTIYVGSQNGFIHALTPEGELKWKAGPHKGEDRVRFRVRKDISPVIDADGTIYIGGVNSDGEGELYAISSHGEVKWTYDLGQAPFHRNQFYEVTGLAIGSDGTIFASTKADESGKLFAFNPDGTLKWDLYFHWQLDRHLNLSDTTVIVGREWSVIGVQMASQSMAEAQWPSYQRDAQNRGSRGPFCVLKPNSKIRPKRININGGMLTLFINRFENSNKPLSQIDPSSVRLANAKPVRWKQTPGFLQLKFRRNQLGVSLSQKGKKWVDKNLTLEGTLKTGGCFKVKEKVTVRP